MNKQKILGIGLIVFGLVVLVLGYSVVVALCVCFPSGPGCTQNIIDSCIFFLMQFISLISFLIIVIGILLIFLKRVPSTRIQQPAIQEAVVYCTKCGTKIKSGSGFCSKCGQKVN